MSKDADVVSARTDGRGISYRNVTIGALLVIAGIIALIIGVASSSLAVSVSVGIAGFVAMLGGVVLAATPGKTATRPGAPRTGPRPQQRPPQGFMDRMNDRWERRQGER